MTTFIACIFSSLGLTSVQVMYNMNYDGTMHGVKPIIHNEVCIGIVQLHVHMAPNIT
jgi:hypothetical protein